MKLAYFKQQGATLVMTAIFIVVLMGVGALALDMGRLFILRTQMQNAVDAAALAAAKELDGESDAWNRAIEAARNLLSHESSYTNDARPLLSDAYLAATTSGSPLPNPNPGVYPNNIFTFYCSIGSSTENGDTCSGSVDPNANDVNKILAEGPADSHYVRIVLDVRNINLFFLPVLSLIPGVDAQTVAGANAVALAGTSTYVCRYPPIMICDPSEAAGDPLEPGDMVRLKEHQGTNSYWVPGDFGWLTPTNGNGAKDLGEALADESDLGCTPPIVETAPGDKGQWPRLGLNTRFGIYKPGSFTPAGYPPAPNVIDYPRDDNMTDDPANPLDNDDEDRNFGDAIWNITEHPDPTITRPSSFSQDIYSQYYHDHLIGHGRPVGWVPEGSSAQGISRFEYYKWELGREAEGEGWENNENTTAVPRYASLDTASVTVDPDPPWSEEEQPYNPAIHNYNDAFRITNGAPLDAPDLANRRVLFVAMLRCIENNIKGRMTIGVPRNGWARFFMTEHMQPPSAHGSPLELKGEFIGYGDGDSDKIHEIVQLYE